MKRNMEQEVVTKGIILRIFNRNPSVFIQQDFEQFVEALVHKLNDLMSTLANL